MPESKFMSVIENNIYKFCYKIEPKINLTPNQITIISFLIGVIANIFLINYFNIQEYKYFLFWLIFHYISRFLDYLDGVKAKSNNCVTKFGKFLDDTFDLIYGSMRYYVFFKNGRYKQLSLEFFILFARKIIDSCPYIFNEKYRMFFDTGMSHFIYYPLFFYIN